MIFMRVRHESAHIAECARSDLVLIKDLRVPTTLLN
jgi:hypothetical protein